MNFSKELKQELLQIKLDNEALKPMLLAFFNLITINDNGVTRFQTTNKVLTAYIQFLIKKLIPNEELIISSNKLELSINSKAIEKIITKDTNFQEAKILNTSENIKTFLRGSFLARGSINNPEKANYHLEIQAKDKASILLLQRKLVDFELNAKVTKRRNNYLVYIKEAEKIAEFLIIIGANQSLFKYEDYRIRRDFNNSLVKTMNCEIHNTTIATEAANKQLALIKALEEYHPHLVKEHKLEKIIELRKENPQASLNELVIKYKEKYDLVISKSSLFRKFEKIAKLVKGTDI